MPDPATASREAAIDALRSQGFRCEQPHRESLHDTAPDSLRLASLAVALGERTGRHVPLRLLFDSRSVGDLLDALESAAAHDAQPASHRQPLDPAGRRDRSLLTFSQERMVFMQGLAEHSAAYSVVFGLLLAGDLDVPRLEQALAVLVERRPALRARFLPSGEGTAMVPFDGFRFRLDRIEPAAPATRAEAIDCAGAYAREPFDLEAGPPFRAALIGADAGESLLVLVFHHVVIDQFAFEALLAELVALYDDPTPRPVAGERRKLGSTRDSYAQWQRNWFRQHAFGKQRTYWMNRMAGAERVTLPPDHARPAFPDFGGRRWPLRVDEATWVALERLAADRQASLAMLLQAALWLLLRNHTGKDDITTGLAIANRNHRGAANVALSLVNTIPLRIDGGGATRFAEVLARARSAFLEGFEHQDLPFDLLVKQLDLDRRAGLSPLFGVMLNVLNVPTTPRAFGDIGIERVEIDRGGSQFDLTLTVDRQFTRTIWFEYAVALYDPATVQRFAGRLEALLAALVAGGLDQDCEHLPHHAPAEAALLRTWSGNSLPVPAAPDPWHLFTEAAGRNAGRIAATDATTCWRYADLERAAASIAAGLQSAGLVSGDRIGVLVDRGVALPAVLWGALAARITFVPLDATLPADRLRHIAADSGMNAVIVQAGAGDLPWLPVSVRRLALDDLLDCDPAPIATAAPDGIAYVLYTSGTTGRPKGVAIPQASLGQFLQAMQRWPGLAAEERVLAVTTLTFDISLLELLLPTSTGASVHVASRDEVRDGAVLATLIREQGISLLQGTPATWYQLKASGWSGDPRLRAFVGGEAFPPGLAAWLLPRVGEVWNLYGPTEATVWITCHRLTDAAATVVPVGRPIDGAKVHVVDGCGREAPVGVEGEIVLGGAGLAEGYVNLPELTAARFRAFPAIDGCDRAYVTGDRGRWHPDGLLEVLGRLDSQLKLRGYRIEATEIETLALEVPGVSKAMASVRSGGEGDDRLVLHVESDADDELPPRVLERLRRGLPDYMLPQQIVPVRSFPLQPNGKVDRIALGQLGPRQSGAETLSAPARPEPQDATEAALLGLWRELLAESSIHVDDDFFRCGGHSLLAMRLVGRIRQDLRLPCTLAEVFRHPTPRTLTAVLRSARPLDAETIVPLRMTGEAPPFFCICGVQLYRRLADALEDSVQMFGAFIPLDPDAAESDGPGVVQDLATRYVEMIRRYQPQGPYRLLGFSLGGVVAYEMAQQLVAARERVESLVLLDSDAPGPERKQWARTAWAKVRRRNAAGSTPDAVTPHIRAIRRYQARPYAGPVLYVEASRAERADAVTGWDQLVPRHHRVVVDCDHLELMQEPQASQVARAIRAHLRLD